MSYPDYASGFTQRKSGNRRNPASVDANVAPFSIANAANTASAVSRPRTCARCIC